MLEKLLLVRHGDAEFYGPEGTDISRRLTKRGKKALKRTYPQTFAGVRARTDVSFWVSPAVRALETAEIAAEACGIGADEFQIHESLYEQDDDEFLAELYAEGDGCVVAVGHIPFVHRVLFALTGEDIPFDKGAAACISFAEGDLRKARLEWFAEGPRV